MKTHLSDEHLLGDMDADDIDYLSRGLEANFGCVIRRYSKIEFRIEPAAGGPAIALNRNVTVVGAWRAAEALAK